MELSAGIQAPARLGYAGSEALELSAGQHLQIRTGSPTVELLDEKVPAGKKWMVQLVVEITETEV